VSAPETSTERIGIPARDTMTAAQREAADAIINGPRKAIFGPFIPLLQTPALMAHIGKVGETLRFNGSLSDAVRELVICAVACHSGNQFEWQLHQPLALKAGVPAACLADLADGRNPRPVPEEACDTALRFAQELMRQHGVSDTTYADAYQHFGTPGVVELTSLVGYFVMVCWVMNVARTPGVAGSVVAPLHAVPR
jgi:4-carboxymuconolactone decarboxylase